MGVRQLVCRRDSLPHLNCFSNCSSFSLLVADIVSCSFAGGKLFVPDVRTVHIRDLNFILRFEIFVHWDG